MQILYSKISICFWSSYILVVTHDRHAVSSELTAMDHESSCHLVASVSVLYYIKRKVKLISLIIFHRFLPPQNMCIRIKDFYFCISCEVGLFLKIALKSVEVEDPILWHLNREEDKITGGNSSGKGGRDVGLWPQLANFKKAFWKGWRYVWKWSYYINSKHKDLAFCWNFLSLTTNM